MVNDIDKKPEFDNERVGLNPFISGLSIAISKRRIDVINKYGDKDVIETDLEITPYTKVFMVESARVQVCDLPLRSKELYLYIIHSVKSATDYVYIERVSYMKQMGIKALNTYKGAINGLCDGLYIMPHHKIKGIYWINPHFFFKGSRINKYKDNLLFKTKR